MFKILKVIFYKCKVPLKFNNNKGYLLPYVIYPVKRTRNLGTQIYVENGFWKDIPPDLLNDKNIFEKIESLIFNSPSEFVNYLKTIETFKRSLSDYCFYFNLIVNEMSKIRLTCCNFGLNEFGSYIKSYELSYVLIPDKIESLDFNSFLSNSFYGCLESNLIKYLINK